MTTYDYERLWFDEITTEGSFPRGSIAMEVVFENDAGEDYVWTPRWDEIQNLYATAERVEETNENGGEDLEKLKALQEFSGPTLTRLAKCINYHTSHTGLKAEFTDGTVKAGNLADRTRINEVFQDAGVSKPEYPDRYNLSDRWKFLRDHLQGLNHENYKNIVSVIESLTHQNRHVDAEERRRTLIEELNKVLTYENMEITLDGSVRLMRS